MLNNSYKLFDIRISLSLSLVFLPELCPSSSVIIFILSFKIVWIRNKLVLVLTKATQDKLLLRVSLNSVTISFRLQYEMHFLQDKNAGLTRNVSIMCTTIFLFWIFFISMHGTINRYS